MNGEDPDRVLTLLQAGDESAARIVHARYAAGLESVARTILAARGAVSPDGDPEDIVQSTFRSFFVGIRAGKFTFGAWAEVWGLLATIAERKCAKRSEYLGAAKRSARRVDFDEAERGNGGGRSVVAPTPMLSPPEAAVLSEQFSHWFASLDDVEREVAMLGMFTPMTREEIALRLHRSTRTIQRIYGNLVDRLHEELGRESAP